MFIFRAGKGMMARAPARRFLIVLKHRKINHPQRLPARFTQPVRYAKFRLADLQSQRAQTMIDHFCTIRAEEDQIAVLRTGAQNGDLIFFGADRAKVVNHSLGALRLKIGQSEFSVAHGLCETGWQPLWVIDFPMFEYDEETARWSACHHPFTSPKDEHLEQLESDPGRCLAKAYDLVLNGWELGGGSVRIHREDVQREVFSAMNISADEAQQKFGFLLNALQYGAPPHGGIAFGLDRIVAMMVGADSIRDVIAFPKTQRAQCLLTQAPSQVDERQLRELHLRVRQ